MQLPIGALEQALLAMQRTKRRSAPTRKGLDPLGLELDTQVPQDPYRYRPGADRERIPAGNAPVPSSSVLNRDDIAGIYRYERPHRFNIPVPAKTERDIVNFVPPVVPKQTNFASAAKMTLGYEGGVSNDKDDRGGLTNLGVIQKTFNAYNKLKGRPQRSVLGITKAEALDVYKTLFWDQVHADRFGPRTAQVLFDSAINFHPDRVIPWMQAALRENPGADDKTLALALLDKRLAAHAKRSMDNGQAKFWKGWYARVQKLKKFVEQ